LAAAVSALASTIPALAAAVSALASTIPALAAAVSALASTIPALTSTITAFLAAANLGSATAANAGLVDGKAGAIAILTAAALSTACSGEISHTEKGDCAQREEQQCQFF
jgi:hypothetical protein